jgi:hypothetical protein
MVVEKAARSCTRALPDQAAAKPEGSNTTTEITKSNPRFIYVARER